MDGALDGSEEPRGVWQLRCNKRQPIAPRHSATVEVALAVVHSVPCACVIGEEGGVSGQSFTRTCACVHMCACACACACVHVCMCACVHVCMCVCACTLHCSWWFQSQSSCSPCHHTLRCCTHDNNIVELWEELKRLAVHANEIRCWRSAKLQQPAAPASKSVRGVGVRLSVSLSPSLSLCLSVSLSLCLSVSLSLCVCGVLEHAKHGVPAMRQGFWDRPWEDGDVDERVLKGEKQLHKCLCARVKNVWRFAHQQNLALTQHCSISGASRKHKHKQRNAKQK